MKIAILGAMPEEIEPLLDSLKDYTYEDFADNRYYFSRLKNHDLVIAYSKIGKVNSALTATILITKYNCDIVLFSGVAGGIDEDLKIGDMLYATSLVQHDLDITAFGHPHGFVPGIEVFTKTSKRLNDIALKCAKQNGITLKSGIIASGDQFICDNSKKEWIKQTFNASAIEMEGASVGLVCHSLGVEFFILRAISDEAGNKAEFDFDKFMVKSAKISADFILDMVKNID